MVLHKRRRFWGCRWTERNCLIIYEVTYPCLSVLHKHLCLILYLSGYEVSPDLSLVAVVHLPRGPTPQKENTAEIKRSTCCSHCFLLLPLFCPSFLRESSERGGGASFVESKVGDFRLSLPGRRKCLDWGKKPASRKRHCLQAILFIDKQIFQSAFKNFHRGKDCFNSDYLLSKEPKKKYPSLWG